MKILNLYAGIGGNRKLWKGHEITAVENNPVIANIYSNLFPKDVVIVEDAHTYLLNNYMKFDVIWSSPPCVTYYAPLIPPTLVNNRHQFWSNKTLRPFQDFHFPGFGHNNKGIEEPIHKLKWLGFDKLSFPQDFKGISRPRQIVDNCVHPSLGLHLLNQVAIFSR